jgi:hypothetical protein
MINIKPTVVCVHCGEAKTLSFLDMIPSPATSGLNIRCANCRRYSNVPKTYAFLAYMLAVSLMMACILGLMFILMPLFKSLPAIISLFGMFLCSYVSFVVSFYLVFRSFFGLIKKPFKSK